MKRKLIRELLEQGGKEVIERARRLIPTDDPVSDAARRVLTDAIAVCQKEGSVDPVSVFNVVSSAPGQLLEFLGGTPAATIDMEVLALAQVQLVATLTSKAGRKKTSVLSRQEQLAAATSRHRAKVRSVRDRRLDVWISSEAGAYLDAVQSAHSCANQSEALELVLAAAMNNGVLKQHQS